ncbi:MAG: hypothetical protein H6806_04965 [Planctomycetes bacterium]|nr:hypothetical protein [Planctomycetota bacterium]MCB9825813.1 hypothetical protein [Planctomycetota bacterium]MCB9829098.1 hypothetical protein [Planctomycetota bacterium]MCB9901212.1 hypothetical protein [Planctomycetota bacterium]
MQRIRSTEAGLPSRARLRTPATAARRALRALATLLLVGSITTSTTGCAGGPPGLPPPPGGNALPGLLLSIGASVGSYFLIKELD